MNSSRNEQVNDNMVNSAQQNKKVNKKLPYLNVNGYRKNCIQILDCNSLSAFGKYIEV